MRSLCRSVAYVPGIGTGWRGLVSRDNRKAVESITDNLTSRGCRSVGLCACAAGDRSGMPLAIAGQFSWCTGIGSV